MRILMVSKALVVGAYQRKLEEMAAVGGVELVAAVPPSWREEANEIRLERAFTTGYTLRVTPMRFNGHYHVHYYPQLSRLIRDVRPDLLHMDEEPFNLATWHGMRLGMRAGMPTVCYAWQNIYQRFPPPFRWLESDVLRHSAACLAGNHAAGEILRRKGFKGPVHVVPQFGIDPELFAPAPVEGRTAFTVGFVCGAGRLVARKGLGVLLDAVARLRGDWVLHVFGTGPDQAQFERQAQTLRIADRVLFRGTVSSVAMADTLRGFDVLAGPSLTTKRWKEQFGRMLVEAMACEVPVVGSDSGEIPQVIGDAGIVVPEGDPAVLAAALQRLHDDGGLRRELGRAGRKRVLALFTQRAVAEQTVNAYREALGQGTARAAQP